MFCGGSPVTDEHVWPRWIGKYLPSEKAEHFVVVEHEGQERTVGFRGERVPFSTTAKCVCEACNTGWMHELETCVFIELLDDPASSAWKYDEHREPIPSAASDRAVLAEVLLEKPESLDDEVIYWCLKHGLSRSATFAGFARWRTRRDPSWVDPAPWLSEAEICLQ